jgi:hypothetical protein
MVMAWKRTSLNVASIVRLEIVEVRTVAEL